MKSNACPRAVIMSKVQGHLCLTGRLLVAAWYCSVGVLGFTLNYQVKDIAKAAAGLERAMAESGFLKPQPCLCCTVGWAAPFLTRSSLLGSVIQSHAVALGPREASNRPRGGSQASVP